jgi:hypothetical protein
MPRENHKYKAKHGPRGVDGAASATLTPIKLAHNIIAKNS